MNIAAVILAAGASDRMLGKHKLLLPVAGRPMITAVVENTVATSFSPIVVVTGFGEEELTPVLQGYDVTVVSNPDWMKGMSGSIRVGIEAFPDDINGAFIILGDMPLLQSATLETLKDRFLRNQGHKIVYPTYQGQQGHPVLFPARFFPALLELTGDQGAKSLLTTFSSEVIDVAVDSREILIDCDTREDYSQILSSIDKRG
ncbi:NTP transferase domain-containing protein [Candidatus Neomarinimicrobiota bacterium]